MLPLLLALGVLASASDVRSCARGAAAGAGGACEADEREETSHLQVRGSVRETGSSIGLGAAPVERVDDISPSAAWRARRSRARRSRPRGGGPKTHVVAAPEGEPDYFWQGYGEPEWSWFTGVVGTDTVSLAGVSAEGQRFGLTQMGNMPIGNVYPENGGPSTDDGIMGLVPGCLMPDSTACKKSDHATDVISNLYFSGKLSEHAFTICLHDSEEGGGMMWLGASSSPLPEGSIEVPLHTAWLYHLVPPAEPDIPFYFGASEPIFTIDASGYDALFDNGYIDSGTDGLSMPEFAYNKVMDALISIWKSDSDIAERVKQCPAMASFFAGNSPTVAIPSEIAKRMKSLVPDLIFTLGDANVSVLGPSLLYQTTPCSGVYGLSWQQSSNWVLGSAFFYGRTLRFDLTTGNLTMIPDDKCKANYGEHGQGTAVSGVPGQVLGEDGAMTAVVSLGEPPQDFVVQLDTGSQDLLVYQDTCMLVGLKANGDCLLVPAPGAMLLGPKTPSAPANFSPPQCLTYLSGLMEALGLTESLPQNVTIKISDMNSNMSKYLKPWQKCNEKRILCGTGAVFNTSASQSLRPTSFPQFVFAQDPPAGSGEAECQVCNT